MSLSKLALRGKECVCVCDTLKDREVPGDIFQATCPSFPLGHKTRLDRPLLLLLSWWLTQSPSEPLCFSVSLFLQAFPPRLHTTVCPSPPFLLLQPLPPFLPGPLPAGLGPGGSQTQLSTTPSSWPGRGGLPELRPMEVGL